MSPGTNRCWDVSSSCWVNSSVGEPVPVAIGDDDDVAAGVISIDMISLARSRVAGSACAMRSYRQFERWTAAGKRVDDGWAGPNIGLRMPGPSARAREVLKARCDAVSVRSAGGTRQGIVVRGGPIESFEGGMSVEKTF